MKCKLLILLIILLCFSCQNEDQFECPEKHIIELLDESETDEHEVEEEFNDSIKNNSVLISSASLTFTQDCYDFFFIIYRSVDKEIYDPIIFIPVTRYRAGTGVSEEDTLSSSSISLGTFEMRLISFNDSIVSLGGIDEINNHIIYGYPWSFDNEFHCYSYKKNIGKFSLCKDDEDIFMNIMKEGVKYLEIITRKTKLEKITCDPNVPEWVRKKLVGTTPISFDTFYFSFIEDTTRYEFEKDIIGKQWIKWCSGGFTTRKI